MQNFVRSVFSFLIIGLFLMAALASFGPDESTNTTVAISNCQPKPHISGTMSVQIHYTDNMGTPIPNITGTIFLTEQKVKPDTTCTFSTFTFPIDVVTDASGSYFSTGYNYGFDNSEDLWRAEVNMPQTAFYTACKEVKVVKYGGEDLITFNCVVKRLNEL